MNEGMSLEAGSGGSSTRALLGRKRSGDGSGEHAHAVGRGGFGLLAVRRRRGGERVDAWGGGGGVDGCAFGSHGEWVSESGFLFFWRGGAVLLLWWRDVCFISKMKNWMQRVAWEYRNSQRSTGQQGRFELIGGTGRRNGERREPTAMGQTEEMRNMGFD